MCSVTIVGTVLKSFQKVACVAGVKREGEGGIWTREGERKGTSARTPLFSPFSRSDSERENSVLSELIKCQFST